MDRLNAVREFIEFESQKNYIIEPQARLDSLRERLFDILNTYKPAVIVKAGIGSGILLQELSSKSDSYIVVVEPSLVAIKKFMEKNSSTRIKFINGDFHEFPVDYYAADLIICIDYLDFFDSNKTVSEFKRALRFDGIFFIATVVLNEQDVDGIYDDLTRMLFPIHNDYYLASDLKTFLELKEFSLVKSMHLNFESNLKSLVGYFQKKFNDIREEEIFEFIKKEKDELSKLMGMDSEYKINEPYYIGVFMKVKPKNAE